MNLKEWRSSPFFFPILGSVLLHLLLLLGGPWFLSYPEAESSLVDSPAVIRLEPLESTKGKIVDILDDAIHEDLAPETNYLSDKNRSVDRETQARDTSLRPQISRRSGSSQESSSNRSSGVLSDFGERRKRQETPDLRLPDHFLNQDKRQSFAMRSRPSNYLPQVDIGSETLLNTREFAYQSFYIRMKRQMEGEWRVRSLMMSQPRVKDQLMAQVNILLDDHGKVLRVNLRQTSGNSGFDREAIRTAREAGPYLNPPDGLVDSNRQILIPQWGFIFSYMTVF